jgi:pyruvate formate lyase activating enzyme
VKGRTAGRGERGVVFDVERFAITDGPGIRTTVFLKGCPLRCAWCQNPEGMSARPEVLYFEHLCGGCRACVGVCEKEAHVFEGTKHVFRRDRCTACGRCAEACPAEALSLSGREMSVDDVMGVVLRDRAFYERSGGGMTLSGGEPMSQPRFAEALLAAAREEGLSTALDTSGVAQWSDYEAVLPLVDLFLFDVKDTDAARHREYTGVDPAAILDSLRRLDEAGAAIRIRCVIVPGVNDAPEHIARAREMARSLKRCAGIDVLRYHALGHGKWRALGREPKEFRT